MKNLVFIAVSVLGAVSASADPAVPSVQVTQAADRTVTVTYELSGAPAIVTFDVLNGGVSIGGTNLWSTFGDVYRKIDADGTYRICWSPDGLGEAFDLHAATLSFQVTAWSLSDPPPYMVCALSTDTLSQKGDVRYYPDETFLPGGLLGNSDYRTTQLVCRRICAKGVTWNMGDPENKSTTAPKHEVTLPKDYFIGVFELTQAQMFNISGWRSSSFSYEGDWAMRPVGNYTLADFRGALYPLSPTDASPLGKLRQVTGLDFEIPSEAQWEFACRSGHYGVREWNNGAVCASGDWWNMAKCKLPGRFTGNSGVDMGKADSYSPDGYLGATNGTAIVGSYEPSSWGLYDMHCNVGECCLDWYVDDLLSTNPNWATGAPNCNGATYADGTVPAKAIHVVRGSDYGGYPDVAGSHCRAKDHGGAKNWYGFRLVLPIE